MDLSPTISGVDSNEGVSPPTQQWFYSPGEAMTVEKKRSTKSNTSTPSFKVPLGWYLVF